MRKRISFSWILLGALLASPIFGQVKSGDTTRISLNEVAIKASRIPEDSRQSVRLTNILTRKTIQQLPASDLAGILRYIPDLDIRQRGPAGVQADISFRGGTFDQTAILVNGINFNDPQTGHFQLDIPIPLSMVQRIEILPGSDVKSLGSNAFAGAVNLVTGAPSGKNVNLRLQAGQYGYVNAGIDAGNVRKKWWQQGGIELVRSDGYRENTDFKTLNGFFQTGFRHKQFDLSMMAGGLKKAFGANSFYSPKYPNQFENSGSGLMALQLSVQGKVNVSQSLYYRIHSDEFTLFRSNPPSWYTSPNYHQTQIAGGKTDAWFSSKLGKTAFGLEMRHESIRSTVLGQLSEQTWPVAGSDSAAYNHFGSRSHFSFSAEQHIVAGAFRFNGGLVLHEVRSVKNYFQAYPGVDIGFIGSEAWRAFISFNRAFRLPTFTELYYKSPVQQGNSDLLPETAWHAEAGTVFNRGGFTSRILGFYRYASQSIDWVRTAEETVWHTENLGQIKTWGFETGLSWTPQTSGAIKKFIDHFNLGYRYYFQHHQAGDYLSQYVLDYLKWKMTTGFTLKVGAPFRLSANLIWQERNGSYTAYDSQNRITEVDYKPFMLVDLKLSYRIKRVTFIAECSNLFNTAYFDLGSVPQPGTWLRAGFVLNMDARK